MKKNNKEELNEDLDIEKNKKSSEDEESEKESSEDEESEEDLENLVNAPVSHYPSKISKESTIAPSLEMSNQSQGLETELRGVSANTNEADAVQSSQYNSSSSNYMSNNYQSSEYTSSTYPEAIKSQESANPFSSDPTPFRNPGIFKSNTPSNSEGYPRETEIRKYDSPSEQKRDKKRY